MRPTCAAMVLKHFGTSITPREIKTLSRGRRYERDEEFSDFTITLFPDLVAGLATRGVQWDLQTYATTAAGYQQGIGAIKRSLDAGPPVLIDTQLFGGHTFVVAGYDEALQHLIVMDPNISAPGLRLITYADVATIWNSRGAGFNTRAAVLTAKP